MGWEKGACEAKEDLQGDMYHAGAGEADCEELKYVPQGPDTTLLVTTGEKALAVKTRNTVSIISLRPTGEVGVAYTTPGQRPSAQAAPKLDSSERRSLWDVNSQRERRSDQDLILIATALT